MHDYRYGRSSLYGNHDGCNPCYPHLEAPGIVAYFDGTDPIRNSVDDTVAFWQSLPDRGLGDCVNSWGRSGRIVYPNFPQFGCNVGQYGGGHGGGYDHSYHGGGSHGACYNPYY